MKKRTEEKSAPPEKILTMNDLNPDEIKEEKDIFTEQYWGTMRKYLGFMGALKLRQGFIGKLLLRVPEIKFNTRYLIGTKIGFSLKPIKIPGNLAIASEMLLQRPFINRGVFRINSTEQRLKDAKSLLFDLSEERVMVEYGKEILDKNFDPIDIAEAYKQMLRGFNTTVIPLTMVPIIKKIQNIANNEDKLCCTKAFLYALPPLNRRILENDVYLCYAVMGRMQMGITKKEHMGMDGMGVVMMPNLFMKTEAQLAIADVLLLVEFSKYLFKNFKELISSSSSKEKSSENK